MSESLRKLQDRFLALPCVIGFTKRLGAEMFLFEPGSPTVNQVRRNLYPKYRDKFERILKSQVTPGSALNSESKVGTSLCTCGCGELTGSAGSRFRPGHDSRFHSRQRKLLDGRLTIQDLKSQLGEQGRYALPTYMKGH